MVAAQFRDAALDFVHRAGRTDTGFRHENRVRRAVRDTGEVQLDLPPVRTDAAAFVPFPSHRDIAAVDAVVRRFSFVFGTFVGAVRRAEERVDIVQPNATLAGAVRVVGAPRLHIAVFEVADKLLIHRVLFDVREQDRHVRETFERVAVAIVFFQNVLRGTSREAVVNIVEILRGQTELLQLVRALHTTSRFANRLNGRKKQTNQDTDDRDNDQQFDEGKPATFRYNSTFQSAIIGNNKAAEPRENAQMQ